MTFVKKIRRAGNKRQRVVLGNVTGSQPSKTFSNPKNGSCNAKTVQRSRTFKMREKKTYPGTETLWKIWRYNFGTPYLVPRVYQTVVFMGPVTLYENKLFSLSKHHLKSQAVFHRVIINAYKTSMGNNLANHFRSRSAVSSLPFLSLQGSDGGCRQQNSTPSQFPG